MTLPRVQSDASITPQEELQQQLKEARRKRTEALATEEERQRKEREPLEEAARQERRIAELESQQRATQIEQYIQIALQLAQDGSAARTELVSELNLLLAHFKTADTRNLQRAMQADKQASKKSSDYSMSVRQQIQGAAEQGADLRGLENRERQQFVTEFIQQRAQQLKGMHSTETAVDNWFDASQPGSKDALLHAVVLFLVTGDEVYLESWKMSPADRRRHRYSKRRHRYSKRGHW